MTQRRKYRIRVVLSANGDRFYAERRGLLWGWNALTHSSEWRADGTYAVKDYGFNYHGHVEYAAAEAVINYCKAEDAEREQIYYYP